MRPALDVGSASSSVITFRERQIAARLVISPNTARRHIEHIYSKIGASSRVTASLFAMQHDLLAGEDLISRQRPYVRLSPSR